MPDEGDNVTILEQLFRQHRWANLALVDFCEGLGPGALKTAAPGTFGNAFDCLSHIVRNEEGYYRAITSQPWIELPEAASLAEIRERMEATAERFLGLAASLGDEAPFESEFQGQVYPRPTYVPLLQCINHGTEHRAHACSSLSVAAVTPPKIDFWEWQQLGQP